MEPVVKDVEDGEDQTDTDQDRQTDTDRTEGEDSVVTPSQSRSPSVHAQEADVDVFDGYSFKGRHSVIIDDENSDLDEDDEYEEDEEEDASKSPVSEDLKDQESVLADSEDRAAETETEEEREAEPRTPEARPTSLPAEVPVEKTKPIAEPAQPTDTIELSVPTKRPSVEIPRPSIDSQGSETFLKSGKQPIPPKSTPIPRSSKQAGKRREKSGIAALDKHFSEGIDELTEREDEDDGWDIVEAGVDEEHNGSKGTSLFARGVVDRYKLAVFRKSTSRHGNRKASGVSKASGTEVASPSPSEKQKRGRTPLSFRNRNIMKTPPPSSPSRTSGTSKQHTLNHSNSLGSSSLTVSTGALNQSSATNTASPSLKSKQSAMSMTSPSESDFSPNDETTRPGAIGGNITRKLVPQSPTDERKKKKKKLKGAEKVLSIFS